MPGVDWRKSTAAFAGISASGANCSSLLQSQQFADAGIVDDGVAIPRVDAVPPAHRYADEIDDLLGDIEAVEMNHAGSIARRCLRFHEECGQRCILIRHFDPAAVWRVIDRNREKQSSASRNAC